MDKIIELMDNYNTLAKKVNKLNVKLNIMKAEMELRDLLKE